MRYTMLLMILFSVNAYADIPVITIKNNNFFPKEITISATNNPQFTVVNLDKNFEALTIKDINLTIGLPLNGKATITLPALTPGNTQISVKFFEGDIVWPEDKKVGTLVVKD